MVVSPWVDTSQKHRANIVKPAMGRHWCDGGGSMVRHGVTMVRPGIWVTMARHGGDHVVKPWW